MPGKACLTCSSTLHLNTRLTFDAKAASDKITREIEMFGPDFSGFKPEPEEPPAESVGTSSATPKAVDKAKKGKVAAKATGLQYQFQIMESMGVPREEIKKFADPYFWLKYYPPICIVSSPIVAHTTTRHLRCRVICTD